MTVDRLHPFAWGGILSSGAGLEGRPARGKNRGACGFPRVGGEAAAPAPRPFDDGRLRARVCIRGRGALSTATPYPGTSPLDHRVAPWRPPRLANSVKCH
jgi:hypothetical protein